MTSRDLLSALNIESATIIPVVSTCPICRVPLALEVTPGLNGIPIYTCTATRCRFIGDGLELYAAARKLDLVSAALEMTSAGICIGAGDLQRNIAEYMGYYLGPDKRVRTWWEESNQRFHEGDSQASGMLQSRGCWESQTATLGPQGLGALLGVRTGGEIKDFLADHRQRAYLLHDWKSYLVMPTWGDPRTISGFLFFDESGDSCYTKLNGNDLTHGIGFLHTTRVNAERVLIVNHPLMAMEYLANLRSAGVMTSVVCCTDATNTWGQLYCKQRIFLNFSDSLKLCSHALRDPTSIMVTSVAHRREPQRLLTPHARVDFLESIASPIHRAIGELLSSMPYSTARTSAMQLGLQNADIARILTGIPEGARERLSGIFRDLQDNQAIQFQNDTITLSNGCWVSAKKGQISNTVFFIDKVICDSWNSQRLAIGTVIQGDSQFQFSVPFADLEKKTEKTLQDILEQNRGDILILAPGWAAKLCHLSMQFRQPVTEHNAVSTGWANDFKRLVLPRLSIENGSIEVTSTPLKGAGTGLESMGEIWEIQELIEDNDVNAVFWALAGAITANVFGPHHSHGTTGIAIVEAKGTLLEQVVSDAVDAIGLERIMFSSASAAVIKEIKNKELKGVLPLYVDEIWARSKGFTQWQKLDAQKNVIVPMAKTVAIATSLQGDWIYLSHKGAPPAEGARKLLKYWNVLPEFWAYLQKSGYQWDKLRSGYLNDLLLTAMNLWLRELGYENPAVLKRAAGLLGVDVMASSPWGYRFLGFLIEAVKAGLTRTYKALETDDTNAGVIIDDNAETAFISRTLVVDLMQGLGVDPPMHKDIIDRLTEASCLQGQKFRSTTGYLMPLDRWNLCWSMKT